MYWLSYIVTSVLLSHLIAKLAKKNYYKILIFLVVILLTPAQIEASVPDYAPSLFTFIFNTFLENNYSARALRPLLLSMSSLLFIFSMYLMLKRKFF